MVLDAATVKKDTQEILETHSIPSQASEDLKDLLQKDAPAEQNGASKSAD